MNRHSVHMMNTNTETNHRTIGLRVSKESTELSAVTNRESSELGYEVVGVTSGRGGLVAPYNADTRCRVSLVNGELMRVPRLPG